MPDTPSITINKIFTYRGLQEVWSNTYHFSGTTPASDTDWRALATAIWTAEKPIFIPDVRFAGYLGYAAGNEHAVSIRDFVADGETLSAGTASDPGTLARMAGDLAVSVRWRTPDRTSKGKPIYLRKYFHGFNSPGDTITNTLKSSLETYGATMTAGTLPGGAKICGPQGAVAGQVKAMTQVTTRTLKRRGKRPSS